MMLWYWTFDVRFAISTRCRKGISIMSSDPTERIVTDPLEPKLEDGTALCLSGGGYRAMLFHVGALWRLSEAGLLRSIKRIASVSGSSITAAALGMQWKNLDFDPANVAKNFDSLVVSSVRELADETINMESAIWGIALPGRVNDQVAGAYDKHLFKGATLQDSPDAPRFVINPTNVQSGALWQFMKPYMRDYRVGEIKKPTVLLSPAAPARRAPTDRRSAD